MDRVQFRLMMLEDIDAICEIEKILFSVPWSKESFEKELDKSYGLSYVAVKDNKVVAYIICWLIANEVHIGNIAVHPDYQRQKIGENLVQKVLSQSENSSWAVLEVRRSNFKAQALYKKLGFKVFGVRRNYYSDNREDAILMSKIIQSKDIK